MPNYPKVQRFRGLNNVTDPVRLGAEWLVRADNVDITDSGGVIAATGFTKTYTASAITGSYATLDLQRMYVVDGGALMAMNNPVSGVVLRTGLASAPMFFTEINDQVFYTNGVDFGIIEQDHSLLPWQWPAPATPNLLAVAGSLDAGLYQVRCTYTLPDGRETGSSESADITLSAGQALQITGISQLPGYITNVYVRPANAEVYQLAQSFTGTAAFVWNASANELGRELQDSFMDPVPMGATIIQAWGGSIYASMYMPDLDQTVVWYSQPLGFHLFDLDEDFFMVPGKVLMMAPHDDAIIVGTEDMIYAYDGKELSRLVEYGVVPGVHWSRDDPDDSGKSRVLFWTTRGVCAALPFKNLTELQVSVAPGVSAGGAIVRSGGQKRFIVALKQGGSAFNLRP